MPRVGSLPANAKELISILNGMAPPPVWRESDGHAIADLESCTIYIHVDIGGELRGFLARNKEHVTTTEALQAYVEDIETISLEGTTWPPTPSTV